jgi:hypothetical protein
LVGTASLVIQVFNCPDVDKMIEMGNEVGWFALFTTLEWILGLIFVLVVMSWKPIFQKPLLEH